MVVVAVEIPVVVEIPVAVEILVVAGSFAAVVVVVAVDGDLVESSAVDPAEVVCFVAGFAGWQRIL